MRSWMSNTCVTQKLRLESWRRWIAASLNATHEEDKEERSLKSWPMKGKRQMTSDIITTSSPPSFVWTDHPSAHRTSSAERFTSLFPHTLILSHFKIPLLPASQHLSSAPISFTLFSHTMYSSFLSSPHCSYHLLSIPLVLVTLNPSPPSKQGAAVQRTYKSWKTWGQILVRFNYNMFLI